MEEVSRKGKRDGRNEKTEVKNEKKGKEDGGVLWRPAFFVCVIAVRRKLITPLVLYLGNGYSAAATSQAELKYILGSKHLLMPRT